LVNIVTAADFHFCDHSPSSRKDDYVETLFGKLEQIRVLCKKTESKFLLIPGDLFHIKTASKNSHRLVQRLMKKFEQFHSFDCRPVLIAGNHDLSFSNLESLEKQPLGVLLSSGCIEGLVRSSDNSWMKNEVIYEHSNFKIRIVGCSFGEPGSGTLESLTFKKKDEDWLLCMAHTFASPLRGNFFGSPVLGYQDMLNLGPDIFIFGHLHKDQGVQTISEKYFVNVGAVTRGSISEDDVKRKPKICVLKINQNSVQVTPICLRIKPAEEIFDLGLKQQEDLRSKEINAFIEMLSKEDQTQSEDVKKHLKDLSFEDIVKEKALYYLEQTIE